MYIPYVLVKGTLKRLILGGVYVNITNKINNIINIKPQIKLYLQQFEYRTLYDTYSDNNIATKKLLISKKAILYPRMPV